LYYVEFSYILNFDTKPSLPWSIVIFGYVVILATRPCKPYGVFKNHSMSNLPIEWFLNTPLLFVATSTNLADCSDPETWPLGRTQISCIAQWQTIHTWVIQVYFVLQPQLCAQSIRKPRPWKCRLRPVLHCRSHL